MGEKNMDTPWNIFNSYTNFFLTTIQYLNGKVEERPISFPEDRFFLIEYHTKMVEYINTLFLLPGQ